MKAIKLHLSRSFTCFTAATGSKMDDQAHSMMVFCHLIRVSTPKQTTSHFFAPFFFLHLQVALVYPNNDPGAFMTAFYGCLLAEVVPVPIEVPLTRKVSRHNTKRSFLVKMATKTSKEPSLYCNRIMNQSDAKKCQNAKSSLDYLESFEPKQNCQNICSALRSFM